MATAIRTRRRTKPKRKQEAPVKATAAPEVATPPATIIATKGETLYLITGEGIEILIGAEGDEIRDKIKEDTDNSPLAYKHYDDDKRVWATWAVLQPGGTVKPVTFPDPSEYGMTPPDLYTKAVTFKTILAHAVGVVRAEKETVWDKMMKPASVITAIVAVIAVVAIFVIGAGG